MGFEALALHVAFAKPIAWLRVRGVDRDGGYRSLFLPFPSLFRLPLCEAKTGGQVASQPMPNVLRAPPRCSRDLVGRQPHPLSAKMGGGVGRSTPRRPGRWL